MFSRQTPWTSHVTLAFCTILHAFTHALGTLLVPLYLLMVTDLHLVWVWKASLIVTISGIVYCLGSYGAGILADRFDRKWLLGIGLIGNSLAFIAMGFTQQYPMLIALGVIAGLFGTLFHPCANSLVPSHYPKNPGLAIGLLGIGSGLGFFFGPLYAGWRAQTGSWQKPCIEMGIAGVITGLLFLLLAKETRKKGVPHGLEEKSVLPARMATEEIVFEYEPSFPSVHLSSAMRWRITAISAVLGLRDFTGVASLTLASLYLQQAHGYTRKQAGFNIGAMMLISILVNPLSVLVSGGKRRLPMLAGLLVAGGAFLALVPFIELKWTLPLLCVFQTCQLGSYAMSDAAMLERVSAEIRGRVVGLFLTLAGTFSSLSPFVIGWWVDLLHDRSHIAIAYTPIFGMLAGMMIVSALAMPLIAKLTHDQKITAAVPQPV